MILVIDTKYTNKRKKNTMDISNIDPEILARKIILIGGPSGGGKTFLRDEMISKFPDDFSSVVTSTSRKNDREGEVDGVHYNFHSTEEFQKLITEGALLEWDKHAGNFYGLEIQQLLNALSSLKKTPILAMTLPGIIAVKKLFPNALTVFVNPGSVEVLESRMRKRSTNVNESDIKARLEQARIDMDQKHLYMKQIANLEGHQGYAVNQLLLFLGEYLHSNRAHYTNIHV